MAKDRLDIIYEDKFMIVVNKPARMLTIATDDEKYNTLYHKVHEYLYKKNKNNKVFIVHRLDKETSGIVLFAKNQELKNAFQEKWNDLCIKREYIAVVEGKPKKSEDRIVEYLQETKTLLTYSVNDKNGKEAITNYKVIKQNRAYSLLDISIETGRKNQIRVAMQDIGNPIVGDTKYGAKRNTLRRMCLHASRLEITNPVTHRPMIFECRMPKEFNVYFPEETKNKDK